MLKMDIQPGSSTCKSRRDSRRKRVWRLVNGVWVLFHVTLILYCLSSAPAGMDNLNIPLRSIREVPVRPGIRPCFVAIFRVSNSTITLPFSLGVEHTMWHTGLSQEKT